ncbi:MAG: type II secretion system F family protein [Planctomycetota bacterium]
MPTFKCEAMDKDGKTVNREVEARNTDEAVAKLREQALFPTRVKEVKKQKTAKDRATQKRAKEQDQQKAGKKKKGGGLGSINITIGGVSTKDLNTFTRQMSTLVDAGIPVVQSLNILEEQMRPCALKNVLAEVAVDVEGGSSLSEALAQHPKAFDNLYVNMVRAGEAGGVLDVVLDRLAQFREKAAELKRKVIGALMYPVAVIGFAVLILFGIMYFIIPQFIEMFEELDVELPLPTKVLLAVSDGVVDYWFLLPLIPIGIFMIYKLIRASYAGRYAVDWLKFRIPIFGTLMEKTAISRFTRTFGTLLTSGVPILEALNITRDTVGNTVLTQALTKVHDSIREGEPIAAPLDETNVCEDMVVNMIDVGEETGNLDSMLEKIADNYDDQVDTMVESLTSLLEPVMIIGLGLIIGFIVISLFLPLIELMSAMG